MTTVWNTPAPVSTTASCWTSCFRPQRHRDRAILRREKNATPIMLLTAKSEVEDKIHGLDCGADDYLTKPFSTGELLARIRALTRRKGEVEVDCLHFAELQLNRQTYDLIQGENRMKLSLKEYQIMEMLLSNPEQIIPKDALSKRSGARKAMSNITISVYISFLRKTDRNSLHSVIRTVSIGYFLEKRHDTAGAAAVYLHYHGADNGAPDPVGALMIRSHELQPDTEPAGADRNQ
ncbi:MAG: response regulator transcription factor [Ruminococcus callidus]